MEHRRLQILFAIIALFAFGVIAWYFFFSAPKEAPTLAEPTNPFNISSLPARFAFIFKNDPPVTSTETEVTGLTKEPFIRVWDKPSTGNLFVSRSYLKEVVATTTLGTSTVLSSKSVRATSTVLLFIDRTTGYVQGYNVDSGHTFQISNTTIPGVYDAHFFLDGNRVLLRYLDTDGRTIKSILATLPTVSEGQDAQPLGAVTSLPNGITSVAVSGSLSQISYLVPNDGGSSVYTITSKGTSLTGNSPFSQWVLSYGGEQLYATTKASAYIEGVVVALPSFNRVFGGKTGLASLPGTAGTMLASMWSSSGLATFSAKGGQITSFGARTLSSKCAALPNAWFICGVPTTLPEGDEGLPDDWYQGRVAFEDTLRMLDGATGNSYILFSFPEKFGAIDVTSLSASKNSKLISLVRKQDGSLFLLNTDLLDGE
jgi:hypothetical protein